MTNTDQKFDFGWHLQLWETEWVIWGYANLGEAAVGIHTAPAEVTVTTTIADGEIYEIKLPFKLPETRDIAFKPEIVERRRGWGWRFKSNNLVHDTGWSIVNSREEALQQAAQDVEESISIRHHERPNWREYVKDVREVKPQGNVFQDILNTV